MHACTAKILITSRMPLGKIVSPFRHRDLFVSATIFIVMITIFVQVGNCELACSDPFGLGVLVCLCWLRCWLKCAGIGVLAWYRAQELPCLS